MKSKILSTILILSIIFMTSLSAFAAENENESEILTQLILKVKQVIEIPNEYSDSSYSLNNLDIFGKNINLWSLSWSDTKNDSKSISVSIDSDCNFYSYYKSEYTKTETGTGSFSKNDAQQVAQQFLEKVIPTHVTQLKEEDNITIGNSYTFKYKLYVNDIPVEFSLVTVDVNKYTNEVTSFSAEGLENINYPSPNNIITKQDAKKIYLDRVGVSLKYHSYFDYKTKKLKLFPAYSLNNDNIIIDSNTGKLMLLYGHGFNPLSRTIVSANEMDTFTDRLSPEEKVEVENTSNLISKEKAESIMRENIPIISSDMKVSSISLNKSYIDNKYVYSIYFEDAFAQVNAVTGELISFSSYKPTEAGSLDLSQTKSKEIAQQFLEKVASDKLTQTRYDEPYIVENPQEIGSNYQFRFIRQINGIDFVDNYLNVEIDKTTGDIIRYSNTWYNNVVINDIEYVMTDEIAFDKLDEVGEFGLSYSMVDEDKMGLVYKFTNLDNEYLLDPIESVRLDYRGKEYEDEFLPEYSDIKGHWCEEYVTKLLENGYYIKGDKFNPNNQITQIRFLKYLYSLNKNYLSTDDEFYQNLIDQKLIDKEDVAPNSYITLQEATKLIVKYLGYEKIAVHPEIFANLFANKISDEYKGYITICYSLGIIEANADNTIRNSDSITNAQTAKMIYKLINLN